MSEFKVYTSGLFDKGTGWAAMIDGGGDPVKLQGYKPEGSQGDADLTPVVEAVQYISQHSPEDANISIVTNSGYVARAWNDWVYQWQSNGWRTKKGDPVKHQNMWKSILEFAKKHTVVIGWEPNLDDNKILKEVKAAAIHALKEKKGQSSGVWEGSKFRAGAVKYLSRFLLEGIEELQEEHSYTKEEIKDAILACYREVVGTKKIAIVTGEEMEMFLSEERKN